MLVINNRKQLQLVSESFSGFRDLVLECRTDLYIDEYKSTLSQNRLIGVRIGFLQTAPRFLIEGIGFATLGHWFRLPSSGERRPTSKLRCLRITCTSISDNTS